MIGCGPGEGDKETVLDYKKSNSDFRQYLKLNIHVQILKCPYKRSIFRNILYIQTALGIPLSPGTPEASIQGQ